MTALAEHETETTTDEEPTLIHLLFVPTDACQLRCSYCYLSHTCHAPRASRFGSPVHTLARTVEALGAAHVMPFTIALHGGEVTTLPTQEFEALVAYIEAYYERNRAFLEQHAHKVGKPHIKTNLYGIDRHLEAIARHNVSISGSLDLPFSLHERYRRTAGGAPTLGKILDNLSLLEQLPNHKKASATIFKEHLDRFDELCRDLVFLHEHTCLDMNDFNFMIGFADDDCGLTPLTGDEQVAFYERIKERFAGTDLEPGLAGPWFAEFTPTYCTGSVNCGEKFFLVDYAGDVHSCVRGQGHAEFCYGNILTDPVERILATAKTRIFAAHAAHPLADECVACGHLRQCLTGCPYVKTFYDIPTSYTCKLQQRLYADHPDLYPASPAPQNDAYRYALLAHPAQAPSLAPRPDFVMPSDLKPLSAIIDEDPKLKGIFDAQAFRLEIDGEVYEMESQVLRTSRELAPIGRASDVRLHIRADILEQNTPWPVNNAVYLMMLSGDLVTYGDEGRTKQEHVFTHQIYTGALKRTAEFRKGWYRVDLSGLFAQYYDCLSPDAPNNFFATTSALRDYHYAKHKGNAFYHLQTVNLPFPNIELLCDDATCARIAEFLLQDRRNRVSVNRQFLSLTDARGAAVMVLPIVPLAAGFEAIVMSNSWTKIAGANTTGNPGFVDDPANWSTYSDSDGTSFTNNNNNNNDNNG